MHNFFALIQEAKSGNPDSMSRLIQEFDPLLKANGRKTGREDGYYDLVLFFIELILKFPIGKFDENSEDKIVMYIKIAIRNKVYDIWRKADPVVSYELADYDRPEEKDAYLWLEWENLLKQLPALQYEIIVGTIWKQESVASIAKQFHVSRQFVSQERKRALAFLYKQLQKGR